MRYTHIGTLEKLGNISPALGCPPELDNKNLWLKTVHAFIAENRDVKLELIWVLLPPCWLAFNVSEDVMQAARGRKSIHGVTQL